MMGFQKYFDPTNKDANEFSAQLFYQPGDSFQLVWGTSGTSSDADFKEVKGGLQSCSDQASAMKPAPS